MVVRLSDIVVFEVVFTLQRRYPQPKGLIRERLLPLLELPGLVLPGLVLPGKQRFRKAFALYAERNISFADAYHAVLMQQLKISQVVSFDSFDSDFDRVAGITRSES